MHRKHSNEVNTYLELEDLFDKRKFEKKVNKAIKQLDSDRTGEEIDIRSL